MTTLAKFLVFFLILAILGLPFNTIFDLGAILGAGVLLAVGTLKLNRQTSIALVAVAIATLSIQSFLPLPPTIEEGHQVFLGEKYGQGLKQQLPTPVYEQLTQAFDHAYPKANRCSINDYGCWKMVPAPEREFAWAADGFWQKPKYSRQVKTINFNSQTQLRLGTVNDSKFNLYLHISEVKRDPIPYYVMYEFPASLVGAKLCWRGTTIWNKHGNYTVQNHTQQACRVISTPGEQIWGLSIDPDKQLTMQPCPTSAFTILAFSSNLNAYG